MREERESNVSARSALLTTSLIEALLSQSPGAPCLNSASSAPTVRSARSYVSCSAQRKDIELVPICRSRSGSAFLRWHGIACRHGRVADPADAPRLLGDCDVVVNSSLATGSPAEIRRTENRIVHNIFVHSKPSATLIHFSTMAVYGDPRPDRSIRWRNPYGRAKLATERQSAPRGPQYPETGVCAAPRTRLRPAAGISSTIRQEIREGTVTLPAQNRSSNCVHTCAIAGAIDQIVRGEAPPGTFDLMNTPRWTWREMYEFEDARARLAAARRMGGARGGLREGRRPLTDHAPVGRACRSAARVVTCSPILRPHAGSHERARDGMVVCQARAIRNRSLERSGSAGRSSFLGGEWDPFLSGARCNPGPVAIHLRPLEPSRGCGACVARGSTRRSTHTTIGCSM